MKAKPQKAEASEPADRKPRPVRREGAQASANWLPVPVSWPARSAWNQPQNVKIRPTPPWPRPGLSLL